MAKMQDNTERVAWAGRRRRSSTSAWCSPPSNRPRWPSTADLRESQIIISAKVSRPRDLVAVYRALAAQTSQPLHLGLTEAGMGVKGLVWSASAMGILLNQGIGDTIRVSLTPRPNGDRREEVYAACELLQALGLRSFAPSITACPGCGRTTSTTFQELAERIQGYVRGMMPAWKTDYEGVEEMTVAVMGCVVNGPGRIEGGQYRDQPAGHGRGADLPGLRGRPPRDDAARLVRRALRGVPPPDRRLRRGEVRPQAGGVTVGAPAAGPRSTAPGR